MSKHPQLLTLAQWTGPEGWRARLPHSDPCHALIWVTRGQGRCLLAGRRRGLGVHNAVVIPAGNLFAIDPGAQFFALVCLMPAGSGLLMPDEATLLRVRDTRAQSDLTGLMETMQREQNEARPFSDEALRAQASRITVWLRRAMIDLDEDMVKPAAAHRLMAAYTALIERDYATGRAMQDHARILGVTPTHLTRISKSTAGISAADLLTGRVLYAARDLLETTARPANQIAAELGFGSAAYFSRFILKHTGQSPTALRKSVAQA